MHNKEWEVTKIQAHTMHFQKTYYLVIQELKEK